MSRIVIYVAALFAAIYAGYWVVGWQGALRAIPAWAEDRRSDGWQVDYSDLSVRGFPSRFDTTLSDLVLADPGTGWSWEGPFFQLLALSYRPNHLIAVLPESHQLSTPLEKYQIKQEQARASLVVSLDTNPQIDRSTVIVDAPVVSGEGWETRAETLRFATRRGEGASMTHTLGLEAVNIRPAETTKAELDPAGLLPGDIETLRLDADLTFDAPWDRSALEQRRPQITALQLREARARWGGMELRFAGDLQFDAFGLGTGEINVQARDWREMLRVAERMSAAPQAALALLERALESLSDLSGRPETLDVTLTVRGGRLSIGIVPIGKLPPLLLR